VNAISPLPASLSKQIGNCLIALVLACSFIEPGTAWGEKKRSTADNDKIAALLRDYRSGIVLIKGKAGSGSGFIAEIKGRKMLVTNAHVLAGLKTPTFTLLDRTRLQVGPAAIAVGHDLVVLSVVEGGTGMPVVGSLDTEAAVGNAIVVLGNPGGADVITPLTGDLIGIGPNRVEIDALIEHGNSGSPIVQLAGGKVIGVATYALENDLLSGEKKVRRFGYRLDSVQKWQPIDWTRFYREADLLEKMETTSSELELAFDELKTPTKRSNARQRKYAYETPAIRSALDNFYTTMAQENSNRDRAVRNLLASLQSASQGDLAAAKPTFTYDFFRRQFENTAVEREEIMKVFVKALQK
jgi:hypothetical protein